MRQYTTILRQILDLFPGSALDELVHAYRGDYRVRTLPCRAQLLALIFMVLRGKDSLRDIEYSIGAHTKRLYHLGINRVCRSTLADANRTRSFHIYRELFYRALERCNRLTPKHGFSFKHPVRILDTTTISLCLSIFPWAACSAKKGAIKIHTELDMAGAIPQFMHITDGRVNELKAFKRWRAQPDSIYVFDRGFFNCGWFYRCIHRRKAFFVTRLKRKVPIVPAHKRTNSHKNIIRDWSVRLAGPISSVRYPIPLRLVEYRDPITGIVYQFLTNIFHLKALTIAHLYKKRWDIELFFKWIKQHLRVTSFIGTSKNAVLTQLWATMFVYLMVSFIKFQTRFKRTLLDLFRMLGEMLMEHVSITDLLSLSPRSLHRARAAPNPQLTLNF